MSKNSRTLLFAGLGTALMAGCASPEGKYPSLAIRDAERVSGAFTPAPPAQPEPTPLADRERIGDALERARDSHEKFLARQPGVGTLARSASGRGPESDRRAEALVALADLTVLRSETTIALADLDQLEVESATQFGATSDVRKAQEYVARLVSEQDAALESLERQMGL